MKKIALLLILAIISGVLFGCDGMDIEDPMLENSIFSDNPTEENSNIIKKLILPYNKNNTLNPILVTDNLNSQMLRLVFDCLVEYDKNYKPILNLANGYEVSGNKYTFHIDTSKTFHSGEALSAYDIEYSFNMAKRNTDSLYNKNFSKIKSFGAISDNRFQVTFYDNYPECFNLLNIPVIKRNSSVKDFVPNGTGKYKLIREGGRDYLKAVFEKANIKEISLFTPKNNETYESCFETGIINVMYSDMGKTEDMGIGGSYFIKEYTQNKLTYLEFNSSNILLQDKNLRKAISISCDRNYFRTNLLLSHGENAYSPFNPTWYKYEEAEITEESYDISKSAFILTENGYQLREGNFYKGETKLSFRLLVNSDNSIKRSIAEKIKVDFAILGIEIIVDERPYDIYRGMLQSRNFDIALCETSISADMDIKDLIDGNKNYGGVYSEEVINAYNDFSEGKADLKGFLTAFEDNMPKVPLFFRNGGMFINGRIKGEISPTPMNCFYEFENWSFK
ncbi:MAG: hypothetical protein IKZ25_04885 [Clostridia bacterium]|nr:hypothetical protein [Clostridia bacterium]